MMTIADAQKYLLDHRTDSGGVRCPCCDQLVKVYRRRLNSAMAYALIDLVKLSSINTESEWQSLHDMKIIQGCRGGRDFAKLRFYGLIAQREPNGVEAREGRLLGFWKPTSKGLDFVAGRISVPASLYFYNSEPIAEDNKYVFVWECLESPFDYWEVMGACPELRKLVAEAGQMSFW